MAVMPDLPHIAIDRTEEWRRSEVPDDGGPVQHRTAMVDVAVGNYVIVSYEVLAQLLGALGFARVDDIDETGSPTRQGDPNE